MSRTAASRPEDVFVFEGGLGSIRAHQMTEAMLSPPPTAAALRMRIYRKRREKRMQCFSFYCSRVKSTD